MSRQREDPLQWNEDKLDKQARRAVQMNDGPPRRLVRLPESLEGLSAYRMAYWQARLKVEKDLLHERLKHDAEQDYTAESVKEGFEIRRLLQEVDADWLRLVSGDNVWRAMAVLLDLVSDARHDVDRHEKGLVALSEESAKHHNAYLAMYVGMRAGMAGKKVITAEIECRNCTDEACPECGSSDTEDEGPEGRERWQ